MIRAAADLESLKALQMHFVKAVSKYLDADLKDSQSNLNAIKIVVLVPYVTNDKLKQCCVQISVLPESRESVRCIILRQISMQTR